MNIMNLLRLKFSLLFLLPAILLLSNTVPAPTDRPALSNGYTDSPLADFLNPDGTLIITPGFSGQIDISGYRLQLDECAGPVAAPDGMASATGTWATLGSGLNGTVNTIVASANGDLYVGGSFTEAGGITANRIAKWDGANWSALGSGLGFTGFDFGRGIKAASDGNVYVVGQFDLTFGAPNNDRNIAKWDGTNWSGVGTGLSSITNDLVESPSGGIYVGGSFGFDSGFPQVTLNRIARLNPPVPCDIAITSVDKTDETCPGEDDGSITINATCSSCASILYSIDGGANTQISPTFTGLMPGTYQPYVEDSGDDTCNDDATEETVADGQDSEAPSISCPGTVTTTGLGANCQKPLSDYTPFVNASDNCDTELTLSQSQQPARSLPVSRIWSLP